MKFGCRAFGSSFSESSLHDLAAVFTVGVFEIRVWKFEIFFIFFLGSQKIYEKEHCNYRGEMKILIIIITQGFSTGLVKPTKTQTRNLHPS